MSTITNEMVARATKENEIVVWIDYDNEKVYSVIGDRLSIWRRNGERVLCRWYYTKEFYLREKTYLVDKLAEDQQYAFERGAEDNDCWDAVIADWEYRVRKITLALEEDDPDIIINEVNYYSI